MEPVVAWVLILAVVAIAGCVPSEQVAVHDSNSPPTEADERASASDESVDKWAASPGFELRTECPPARELQQAEVGLPGLTAVPETVTVQYQYRVGDFEGVLVILGYVEPEHAHVFDQANKMWERCFLEISVAAHPVARPRMAFGMTSLNATGQMGGPGPTSTRSLMETIGL